MKIKTTIKELREGVKLSSKAGDEVHWESTGHLSVRLLDAAGHHPLVGRAVTVEIPGEGSVSLETNKKGELFHPDVPYKDYELDIDGLKVLVPAVGQKTEIHERHVAAVRMGYVQGVVYDAHGMVLAKTTLEVQFASGAVVEAETDEDGVVRCHHDDPGEGDVTVRHAAGTCSGRPLASPQKLIRLQLEATT